MEHELSEERPPGVQSLTETSFPKLSRSPLREALLDIRLKELLPTSFLSKVTSLADFPVVREMKQGQVRVEVDKEKFLATTVSNDEMYSRRFEKQDSSKIVQFRRNGFTYSILKGYSNWEVLRDSARPAWQRFLEASGKVDVNRLALRYINAINIRGGVDIDEYLTSGPQIPKPLPQVLNNFIHRVVVPFEDNKAEAIITQAMERGDTAGIIPTLLDIDVYSDCNLDGASEDIWTILEGLRIIANRIFFSSITPKALESFK